MTITDCRLILKSLCQMKSFFDGYEYNDVRSRNTLEELISYYKESLICMLSSRMSSTIYDLVETMSYDDLHPWMMECSHNDEVRYLHSDLRFFTYIEPRICEIREMMSFIPPSTRTDPLIGVRSEMHQINLNWLFKKSGYRFEYSHRDVMCELKKSYSKRMFQKYVGVCACIDVITNTDLLMHNDILFQSIMSEIEVISIEIGNNYYGLNNHYVSESLSRKQITQFKHLIVFYVRNYLKYMHC